MNVRLAAPKAVYIHIPFCTNKCFYCDFNSFVLQGQPVEAYLDALEREMELTVAQVPPGEIKTIFVGGGTPTVLTPPQMEKFLRIVGKYFPLDHPELEFSMEANPGTTDEEKLAVMRAGGVNRLSFGVQSFDNGLLERIGRIHNTDDVYRSVANAKKVGFDNISIDLMFGLPKQTVDIMNTTLDEALKLDLQHYSIYSLKVEENTLFHTLFNKNQLPLPDEDEELAMYELIMRRLKEAGYEQYEISNFARPGRKSMHNITYWLNHPYYGLGAGAHGYVRGLRHVNVKGVQPYINATEKGLPILEKHEVSTKEAMEDFMMVGLRLLDGVCSADFEAQFDVLLHDVFGAKLDKLVQQGLLIETDGPTYRLSDRGLLLGNEVFGEFLE
ncbi:radical SAM family heme chaperone HemW [Paenibacillus sp. N1-5-1-14]|uniref:radical SAM family heme chaperone HemW n=1 Tax=Paenibacillus radicibacter TaxID=2972488 RepID=UPI0021594EA1|nr:radical SAM family heme chaperone HemW [Paenibacillus radicibacter]MCR8645713.1 radical SAM family heme chaperone HemW [Paenibacillus radicibacter]